MATEFSVTLVPVTPFAQNCAVLMDTASHEAVVIDPGGDAERIAAAVAGLRANVREIWLTHGHLDHAGGVEALRGSLAGKVEVIGPHADDAFLLRSIAQQAALYGIPGLQDARTDRYLREGETLHLGTQVFDVLHCPGHTPGHVVFVNRAARFAVVGDVLFAGSVGRTDFAYGDHAALIAGIRQKLLPLGDDFAFICGHGPGSTLGTERRGNPFLQG